jgi:TPP-dependent indolepyruvate ferredoxin oxidoreductase alpha subunit
MNTQRKPSEVHANPELLKIKAAQANARRKERLDQKKADENVRHREEMRAKRAAEEAEPIKEEPVKQEKSTKKGGIKIIMNGVEYKTLTDAVIILPGCSNQRGEDGLHSHFTVSMWNKINRQLKKTGEFTMEGYLIKKI